MTTELKQLLASVPDRQEAILAALHHCPLYFILDESLLTAHEPLDLTRRVLHAGVRMLQLRLKSLAFAEQLPLAKELRGITGEHGCLYVVNDCLELATACAADGVHLGAEDLAVSAARSQYPDLIIGATARTPETAWQAEVDGADYVGCGSVFASATKPGLPVIGAAGLAVVNRYISIPVVGIGGITELNCANVMATGVAGFCSIEPFRGGDPAATVSRFITAVGPPTM